MLLNSNSLVVFISVVTASVVILLTIIYGVVRQRSRAKKIRSTKTNGTSFVAADTSLEPNAELRQRVNKLLEQSDQQISQLRGAFDIGSLYEKRNSLLQALLIDACTLTNASHGRIFRTLNAYHKSDGTIDKEFGYLVELIVAPQPLPEGEDPQYFGLKELAYLQEERKKTIATLELLPEQQSSGVVTVSGLSKYLFGGPDKPKPSDTFLDPSAQSGILIPLFEGLNVVGMLSLEGRDPNDFSDMNATLVDACEQIAWMASDIIASAKSRLEDFQSNTLVDVYQDIMYMKRPDMDEFIKRILEVATTLTARPPEWAQVILIRHYPYDEEDQIQRIEKSYTLRLSTNGQKDWKISSAEGLNFEEDYPKVTYPAFERVIDHQRSHLNVDLQADREWKGRPDIPWPNSRSFICLPLIRPLDDLRDKEQRVFGLLSLATSRPCAFNDSDDRVLTDFTQAIPLGIRNIELLEEASGLVASMQHGLGKAVIPLYKEVRRDPASWDALKVRNLASLIRDLMRWFFELANEDDDLDDSDDIEPMTAQEILDGLRGPMEILASVTSQKNLIMHIDPVRPLRILAGRTRAGYLSAALFLYIENAFKYDPDHDIEVTAAHEEDDGVPYVRFDVVSRGPAIPEPERPLLFKRGYRGTTTLQGEGIGLYQVRRISVHLGGIAGYRFGPPDKNVFFIRLPWVSGTIKE